MISTTKPNLDTVFRDAFNYWKNTLGYQVLFSLLYFTVFFIVIYFAAEQFGIIEEYLAIVTKGSGNIQNMQKEVMALTKIPGFQYFSWAIIGATVFLFPLNIGFFKIFKKIDLKEKVELQDLFSGYSGINFFIYISYYLFWVMIYNALAPTIIGGLLWILITLFTAPLMFFENKTIFSTIKINFEVLKKNFLVVLVSVIAAIVIKYMGLLVFGIGILFTYPFFIVMLYSLYKSIFAADVVIEKVENL